uniref:DDB1- and CUL4-associated factor 11 n=1 Tax=Myxine glutinosa TaxID=7769 RepID=UPI00358E541F
MGLRGSRAMERDEDIANILPFLTRNLLDEIHRHSPLSQSGDESESERGWNGRLGDCYNPPEDTNPDTTEVKHSTIQQQILLDTGGVFNLKPQTTRCHTLPRLLHQREAGICRGRSFSNGQQAQVLSRFIPKHIWRKEKLGEKVFCGVYTVDGSMFLSACQDQKIRMYNTRNGSFKKFKTVRAQDMGWSVLDTAFTPDGAHFLYSSWSNYIHICNIYGKHETHTPLDLSPFVRRFCVFSLSVSSDSQEIMGGANDGCVYVFDRERNQRTLKIDSHEEDVNAVTFMDEGSQILVSGGDDAVCKVWDRRSLREQNPQPVGVLAGHRDGVTFIDTKGDSRYLISNSKDQTIKLWDVRRFSPKEGLDASWNAVTQQNWDYRWQRVPSCSLKKHKLRGDTSVMTYRGHGVLHTLIRCRFSPSCSTGQRYIYTGCSTGRVIIYDLLSGRIVHQLHGHSACVRDVHWHPYEPIITTSSWDGILGVWRYQQ